MAHRSQWSHSTCEVTVFFVSFSRYTVFQKANPLVLIVNKLSQNLAQKDEQKGMSDSVTWTLGQHTIYIKQTPVCHTVREKHPDQPDMLDAINTLNSNHRSPVLFMTPDTYENRNTRNFSDKGGCEPIIYHIFVKN